MYIKKYNLKLIILITLTIFFNLKKLLSTYFMEDQIFNTDNNTINIIKFNINCDH